MKDNKLVKEVDMIYIARKTRMLGIAIMLGIVLVFFLGLFVSHYNINEEYAIMNHITLGICILLCTLSYFVRLQLFKNVTYNNFTSKYFTAYIIPFALCDFGGLLCITTSLFINQNIPYAIIGLVFSIAFLILNFPGLEDYKNLSS